MNADHGYSMLVAAGYSLFLFGLGGQVGAYRKAAGVPYPYMSCSKAEIEAEKDSKHKHLFNCAQRVHQNSLEAAPTFLTLFAISSIHFPRYSAICGAIYCLGRVLFSRGYMTGDPKKRMNGAVGYIGLIGLLGSTIYSAYLTIVQ
jgi:glutathione S-transferase